jgi:hypothetical protein
MTTKGVARFLAVSLAGSRYRERRVRTESVWDEVVSEREGAL